MIELLQNAFIPYFEDDPAPDPAPADPAPADPAPSDPDPAPAPTGKSFTQDELNKIVAKEKGKWKDAHDKAIEQLEEQKKNSALTAEERDKLSVKIDELKTAHMTESQKADRERKKIADNAANREKELTTEVDSWKGRFTEAEITRAISDAAAVEDAFNPDQIRAILRDKTRLVDLANDNGEPTGVLRPKVRFPDVDKDGKDIVTELTVPEAVKRMKELPDLYGNLFKGTAKGGLGGNTVPSSGGPIDVSKMSQEEYEKNRDKIKAQAGSVRR